MKQTIIADSTRISTFLECNQKLNLAYIENLTPSNEIEDALAAGTYGHKLLEIYYKTLPRGQAQAIAECNKFHLEDSFPLEKEKRDAIAERFKYYWMRYSQADFTTLTRQKKSISFNAAGLPIDSVEDEPLVEQGFSYKLYDFNEYLFVLEGRIDWMAQTQGMNVWVDHKFQFRKRNLYEKSIQFRNYSLATGFNLGVINYIRLSKSIEADTLQRQIVSFSPLDQKEWKQELIEIFIQIAKAERSGTFRKNRSACEGKFGYKCPYTSICEEYHKDTIEAIKSTKYVKREEWKPW